MKKQNFKYYFISAVAIGILWLAPARAEETTTNTLKISADNLSPLINTTSTITAEYFDASTSCWAIATNTIYAVNGQETAEEDGILEIFTSTATPYTIFAKKDGFNNSDNIIIAAQLPTINIYLQIETASGTILNQNLDVLACETKPDNGLYTLNARCALEQAGTTNNWSWWGDDAFLNSINEYANDYVNNIYWGWFENLNYGQVALNKHILTANEKLLLVYNTNPLKISATPTSSAIGATSSIILRQFGLDANWNPTWLPAASGTVVINSHEFTTTDGAYELLVATTTPYTIYGKKGGYLDSAAIIVTGYEQTNHQNNDEPNNNNGGSNNGNSSNPPPINHLDNDNAIKFLLNQQNVDGSFGSVLYSDWVAIALGAYGQENAAKDKLKQFLLADPNPVAGLNNVSDYARRAMALMALNINPYNGTPTDYIQKISSRFDGRQFGDPNLYNDDIFTLFPLLKAGYSPTDSIITNTVNFIISKQNTNGSWGSVDLTAAAAQALLPLTALEGVNNALNLAKNFLHERQESDGGFGNIFSTAWTMQAIAAWDENQSSWTKNYKTPNDYLSAHQYSDGGLDNPSAPTSTRIWATAYAVPAALSKPWNQVLGSFSKPKDNDINGGLDFNLNTSTLFATSTAITNTSTLMDAVTTTPADTTTPSVATTTFSKDNKKYFADNSPQPANKKIFVRQNPYHQQPPSLFSNTSATNSIIKQNSNQPDISEEINKLPLPAPVRQAAKRIMAVSGGGMLAVGLYLGLKLWRGMI